MRVAACIAPQNCAVSRAAAGNAGRAAALRGADALNSFHRKGAPSAPPGRVTAARCLALCQRERHLSVLWRREPRSSPLSEPIRPAGPGGRDFGACALAAGGPPDRCADERPAHGKPWFNGRLGVAPPVVDLTAQGFTLIGGGLTISTASLSPHRLPTSHARDQSRRAGTASAQGGRNARRCGVQRRALSGSRVLRGRDISPG